MRKPWAGTGFFLRSGHAGLCAGDSPPARSVLRQLAHFGAPGRSFGLGTTAVASRRSNLTEASRSVGENGNGDRRDDNEEFDEEPESQAREAASKRRLHRAEFQSETKKNR
jgi:hypothetical protein